MEQSLVELTQKIDLLASQVQYLTEQAHAAERARSERAELMHDVMPIVNDVYRISVEQLEEVEEYVDLSDLLRLFKRLLRNGHSFELLLDQLESVLDLLATVGPLSDQAFGKAVDLLQAAEQKGYFVFARGGLRIVDNAVASLDEDDLRQLGDNVGPLLQVAKKMVQPGVIGLVQDVISVVDTGQIAQPETSMMSLLRQMRDPDVRRGLALTLRILGAIGAHAAGRTGAA